MPPVPEPVEGPVINHQGFLSLWPLSPVEASKDPI